MEDDAVYTVPASFGTAEKTVWITFSLAAQSRRNQAPSDLTVKSKGGGLVIHRFR